MIVLIRSVSGLSIQPRPDPTKSKRRNLAHFSQTNHNYTLLWAWRCRESPRKKSTKGRKFLWFCQFSIIILSMSIMNRNSHHHPCFVDSDHNMKNYNNQPLMSRKIPTDLLKSVEQFGIKNAEILPSGCGRLSNGNINGSLWVEK